MIMREFVVAQIVAVRPVVVPVMPLELEKELLLFVVVEKQRLFELLRIADRL